MCSPMTYAGAGQCLVSIRFAPTATSDAHGCQSGSVHAVAPAGIGWAPMGTNSHVDRAKTALDAASTTLKNPSGGSYENAIAVALIGIGHALVAIAERDEPDEPKDRTLRAH